MADRQRQTWWWNRRRRRSMLRGVPAVRKPSLDFSMTGLIYTTMMLFMGLAAINSEANLLFGVFGLMIGVLLVAGVVSRMVLRKLEVRRMLPEHLVVGEPATIQYEIANEKRYWPSLSVSLHEVSGSEWYTQQPQAYLLHAAAGTDATVPMQVVPARRGLCELGRYQLGTSFPFGFIKRAVDRQQPETVLIYPPRAKVSGRLLTMCRSADQIASQMRPRRGGDDEFYGVKEYRPGENPRNIYWRRSARTGTLVSREMTRVAPPRLLVLVDTHLAERSVEAHRHVEWCIAATASLASAALEQGMAVGMIAWTGEGWGNLVPGRGKRHARELMAVLSRLPLNTEASCEQLVAEGVSQLRPGATAMLFTPGRYHGESASESRGSLVVVSATSPTAQAWFTFAPDVDLSRCMPPDQQPAQEAA